MTWFVASPGVSDLLELQIQEIDIKQDDTVNANDVIHYNSVTAQWEYIQLLIKPVGGSAEVASGFDLDLNGGDILLDTGSLVDGVDVSEKDAEKLRGLDINADMGVEPAEDKMTYYDLTENSWRIGKGDLINGGNSADHFHNTDRARANHTGTQTASTISDFDTEVGNHTDVAANTTDRHSHNYCSARLDSSQSCATSWTAITWASGISSGIVLNSAADEWEFDEAGDYFITVRMGTDYNINNENIGVKVQIDTGGGFGDIAMSLAYQHTSSETACQVISTFGRAFSAGDKIKVYAIIKSTDVGSQWLQNECHLTIFQLGS